MFAHKQKAATFKNISLVNVDIEEMPGDSLYYAGGVVDNVMDPAGTRQRIYHKTYIYNCFVSGVISSS